MKSGHQDFWVAGSRLYFKRDAVDGVSQPMIDLGTIKGASPALTMSKLELKDADGGVMRLVDQSVSGIDEVYDVTTNNLNPENMAMLFFANRPSAFEQSAAEHAVEHEVHEGHLLKILDSNGAKLYSLACVAGIRKGTVTSGTVTGIVKSTKSITISEDVAVAAGLAAGKSIILTGKGLASKKNAGTYTVVSATDNGSTTTIVVEEDFDASETAITGELFYENAGEIYDRASFEVVSLDRGLIRIVEDGGITDLDDVIVYFSTAAITGNRLIRPQDLQGEIEGDLVIIWSRGNNKDQSVRECRAVITPNGSNITAESYSDISLQFRVISDPADTTEPAGRLINFKGDLPDKS